MFRFIPIIFSDKSSIPSYVLFAVVFEKKKRIHEDIVLPKSSFGFEKTYN